MKFGVCFWRISRILQLGGNEQPEVLVYIYWLVSSQINLLLSVWQCYELLLYYRLENIALLIAVPLGVGTALFLTELAPLRVRQPIVMVIEMLAAVPSVIFGLWGIFVLIPWLRDHLFRLAEARARVSAAFPGPDLRVSMLAAGIIVAIMILPIVTSVSREILRSVPDLQREAAYALGATRWEVIRIAVLSYARRGLFGAAILGLGRALGETMAVTMVIGNRPQITASLFAPGYTLASVIANEFTEATTDLYLSALFELGPGPPRRDDPRQRRWRSSCCKSTRGRPDQGLT